MTTLKQWQRRALKAEAELDIIRQCRDADKAMAMQTWQELAIQKVALNEIREALEFVGGAG